jgi:hypothetical protein
MFKKEIVGSEDEEMMFASVIRTEEDPIIEQQLRLAEES